MTRLISVFARCTLALALVGWLPLEGAQAQDAPATPAPTSPAVPPAAVAPAEPADPPSQNTANRKATEDRKAASQSELPAVANFDEAFSRALTAYNAGAFEEARRDFLAIVESGKISAPVAHNLGNIEFRRGEPGQAVLWYKRALALNPASPETLQNLRTVRRQTGFLTFDNWGLSLAHLKPRWLETITILAGWLVIILVLWLAILTPRPGRRWPLVALLIPLVPMLFLCAFLTWKSRHDPHPLVKRQVISGKETNAYAAPAEASSTIIRLPAGSEVVPIETRGNWLYCIIPGAPEDPPVRGWVRAAKMEPLWPWPGGV